jgi:hypothetical protein
LKNFAHRPIFFQIKKNLAAAGGSCLRKKYKFQRMKRQLIMPKTHDALCVHLPIVLAELTLEFMMASKRTSKDIAICGEYETCLNLPSRWVNDAFAGACFGGWSELIDLLISKGAASWNTSLYYAARANYVAVTQFLLTQGANVTFGLQGACRGGHSELAQFFLEKGGEPDVDAALRCACRGGHLELAKLLITKGANLNSGLHGACRGGHLQLAQFLVNEGALAFEEGLTRACQGGHLEVAKLMAEKGASDFDTPFWITSSRGHLHVLQWLRFKGASMLNEGLRRASSAGHTSTAQWLISQGANVVDE